MDHLRPGTIVWSSINGKMYWPAVVINPSDCYWKTPSEGKKLVFWFGDNRVSEVMTSRIFCFRKKFSAYYYKGQKTSSKTWKIGVDEAIQAYAGNIGYIRNNWSPHSALRWAQNGFQGKIPAEQYTPDIPLFVYKKLKVIAKNIKESNDESGKSLNDQQKDTQMKLKRREIGIEEVCVCCYHQNATHKHPLFKANVCDICVESLRSTMYCFGDDGVNYFCAICTKAGDVIICDNAHCGRVYCQDCIGILGAKDALSHIMQQNPWLCFMCDPYQNGLNGLLVLRENLQNEIFALFSVSRTFPFEKKKIPKIKKPMRILSLFDGIGTGLHVLDKLNIAVEKYYSCEIDPDAINVVRMHFGDRVEYINDVKELTNETIKDLGPIDMLIGGSPCNDLSLVNPARKGLYDSSGTGILFFDYFRILKYLESHNKDRPFFWLFENVVAMPKDTKITISRFLECEPIVLDAYRFSAQQRPRFFWGNLPSLYNEVKLNSDIVLDDCLLKNCNRSAVVQKLRTVTTNPNSLLQGTSKLQPVLMNGKEDTVWITELEEIFGFPRHYTDIGNLSLSRRQQLLGRAWSVPVIQWIFHYLKSFFKNK